MVTVLGFRYPTRMAVIRLADGGLFVWSPVALTDDLKTKVTALGPVRHIVAPNSLHHLFLPEWVNAFPEALVSAPPGLRAKRKDIAFDADLDDRPPPDWAGEIDQVVMRGNKITTEVVFFHRASGTILFTDLLQQFPSGWHTGWRALIARLDLMVEEEPAVPRKFRLAFTDKELARAGLAQIRSWPAEQVLMAHGTPVIENAKDYLRRAFNWLA